MALTAGSVSSSVMGAFRKCSLATQNERAFGLAFRSPWPRPARRPSALQATKRRAGQSLAGGQQHAAATPRRLAASQWRAAEQQEPTAQVEGELPQLGGSSDGSGPPGTLAGVGALALLLLVLGVGAAHKDDIKDIVMSFIGTIQGLGPLGYLAYAAVYMGLEVLAVPAVPFTMAAGALFGPVRGTAVASLAGTVAACIAFLIARYAARDRVSQWAQGNPKFAAIDRAIAKDGFKFVTLLRISPLCPFAAGNYLYGLTSVDLASYAAGTLLGNLPGTYAYVSAGALANAALLSGAGAGGEAGVAAWQVALGLGAALLAIGYVGRTAKEAIEQAERELEG